MAECSVRVFGKTKTGEEVKEYTLINKYGMTLKVIDYGCAVKNILVPARNGKLIDVALGYDNLQDYENGGIFMGAIVGRYAGRIKNAEFSIGDKLYKLPKNDGKNHLHGILSHKVFKSRIAGDGIVMEYSSPPEEEGYPGTLDICVKYKLNDDNSFSIEHTATADNDTAINLINHTYFNLEGQTGGDVLSHKARLFSDRYLETDKETLPTGKILSTKETPLDFGTFKEIGRDMEPLVKICGGYDHKMIINCEKGKPFAEVFSNKTGIKLSAFTTDPAFNFYSGFYIDTDKILLSKCGKKYPRYGGFCLETCHLDLNRAPLFLNTVKKNEKYYQKTVFGFSNV